MARFAFLCFCLLLSPCFSTEAQSTRPTGVELRFSHDGVDRIYRYFTPADLKESENPSPLVVCLHGGGTDAATLSKSGWSTVASRENFRVIYPEGLNGRWNDGRIVRKHREQDEVTDDVDFLIQLIQHLISTEPIDPERIYVTGLSNGGFMTQRLANEHTALFAAAAVQIATLPSAYRRGDLSFSPKAPLSVLFMNGTADPFMPYHGGKLTPNLFPHRIDSRTFDFGQDSAISTDEAVGLWIKHNKLNESEVLTKTLPDQDPDDGCKVIHKSWKSTSSPLSVELYRIEGGGHTSPGGFQYLPKPVIGPVCMDINGIETIWNFFERNSRKK